MSPIRCCCSYIRDLYECLMITLTFILGHDGTAEYHRPELEWIEMSMSSKYEALACPVRLSAYTQAWFYSVSEAGSWD